MKLSILAATAALLLTTSAQAGHISYIYSSRDWKAWHMDQNDKGASMCALQSNRALGKILVKYTIQRGAFIEFTKSNWSLPSGKQVPLKVQFDGQSPWHITAVTYQTNDGWSVVSATLGKNAVDFLQQFRDADEMRVNFIYGTEPTLFTKMDGSEKAIDWFSWCSMKIDPSLSAPSTQPEPTPGT